MLTKKYFALLALVSMALLAGCATEPEAPEPETLPQPPAQTQAQAAPATPLPPASAACSCTCPACPEATTRAVVPSVAARPVPLAPQAEVATPAATASTPAKTPAPASAKAAAEGGFNLEPGFYIKVGVFSVPENAKTAYKKLVAAGLPAISYSTDTQKGALTRIRVGPYPSRIAALEAVKKVHALQLDGFVVQY